MSDPSVWSPGTSLVVGPTRIVSESFSATASQTLFTLTAFTYVLGTNALRVHINGVTQRYLIDFVETSTSSFTLLNASLVAGDSVYVEGWIDGTLSSNTDPNIRTELATDNQITTGANMIGYVPDLIGALHMTVHQALARDNKVAYVWDFLPAARKTDLINGNILPGSGVASYIQAAVDSVCPTHDGTTVPCAGIIVLPPFAMRIGTTLNLTNSRDIGTKIRDGLKVIGSPAGTRLFGFTGDNKAIIETTGSQYLVLQDFWLGTNGVAHGGTCSSIGIYQGGRVNFAGSGSPSTVTNNQRFCNITIDMADDMNANGTLSDGSYTIPYMAPFTAVPLSFGQGTYGIMNYGSEENTYVGCAIYANSPYVISSYKESSPFGWYPNSYQTIVAEPQSCGVNNFTGETLLVSRRRYQAPLRTQAVNSLSFTNLYAVATPDSGPNEYWWECRSDYGSGSIQGLVEGLSGMLVYGRIQNADINMIHGDVYSGATQGYIVLANNDTGQLVNSTVKLFGNSSVSRDRKLFGLGAAPVNTPSICYVQNTEIRTNITYTKLMEDMEYIKWNYKTSNVDIYGNFTKGAATSLGYHYHIGDRIDTLPIPTTRVIPVGGGFLNGVVIIKLPTVIGATNGLAVSVKISGIISVDNPNSNEHSCMYVERNAIISVDRDGLIYSSVGVAAAAYGEITLDTVTVNTAAGVSNNLVMNDGAASQGLYIVPNAGTNLVTLYINPVNLGGNALNENIDFTGKAEMFWNGNNSRAPHIVLVPGV